MSMMAAQFLDITGKSVLTAKIDDLVDAGWAVLPEPPNVGSFISINDVMMRIVGFQYLVKTIQGPVTTNTQLNVPALQVFICVPGREPRAPNLVAPVGSLDGMQAMGRG
jgi:hypothetical protein